MENFTEEREVENVENKDFDGDDITIDIELDKLFADL